MNRSAVPPPVTAVMDVAAAWLPARMSEVELGLWPQSKKLLLCSRSGVGRFDPKV